MRGLLYSILLYTLWADARQPRTGARRADSVNQPEGTSANSEEAENSEEPGRPNGYRI